MNIQSTLKKEWPVIVLLLAPFVASLLLWNEVPDTLPTHFNLQGEADDYGPKWIILLMLPAIGLVSYLGLLLLPYIDPKKRIESSQKPIAAIRVVVSLFMAGLYTLIVLIALGHDLNTDTYITVAVGFLLMLVGNYMNSVKPNYFIGIRTPWTLENATVWKKTHRLGSKIWMVGGIIIMLSPLLFNSAITGEWMMGITIAVMVLVPLVYSYYIFNKLEQKPEENP